MCIKDDCGAWGMSRGVCHMTGAAQLELAATIEMCLPGFWLVSRQLHSHSPTSSRQNTYKTKQTCNNYDLSINNARLASVLQPLTSNSSGQQVNYALIFTIVQFPTPSLSDNVLFCLFSCSAMMTALRMASYSLLQLAASSGSVCETYAIKQVGMFQHGTPEYTT